MLGNWTTTLSNRAFNEVRVTYGVNKPWILSNIAGELGGSDLLEAAGYNTTTGNPTGKFASHQLSGRDLRRDVLHRARRGSNLFMIDNFSLDRRPHQFKFGGIRSRAQQMFMDVEAAHKGSVDVHAGSRPFDINNPASFPTSFSGNIGSGQAYPVGLESVVLRPGHVAGRPAT